MNMEDYQDELNENPTPCPQCYSADIVCLGSLGPLVHCRCRACGWTFALEDHGEVTS